MSDTTFELFVDAVTELAKFTFKKIGQHPPLFYVDMAEKPGIGLIPAPWQTIRQKNALLAGMRMGIDIGAVRQVCFATEMWFAEQEHDGDKASLDMSKIVPPSQRADRRELLGLVFVDKVQHRFVQYEIKRPAKGKAKLELMDWKRGEMEMISSGFSALVGGSREGALQ